MGDRDRAGESTRGRRCRQRGSACLMSPTSRRFPAGSFLAGESFTRHSGIIRNRRRENGLHRSAPGPALSSTCLPLAAETEHLTVFQRTPIWVAPRFDDPFTSEQPRVVRERPRRSAEASRWAFQQYEVADFDVESDMTKMLTEMSYKLPDEKGERSAVALEVVAGLPRWLQAAAAVEDVVSGIRSTERHAGNRSDRCLHRTRSAHRGRCRAPGRHGDLRNRFSRPPII